MATELEKLQLEFFEATERHRDILRAKRDERDEKQQEFLAKVDVELSGKYNERIKAAHDEMRAAERAFELARIVETRRTLRVREGTVMCEWGSPTKWGSHKERVLTGRKGVVEVITHESAHPATLEHGRAKIGIAVVRLLKKDGSQSLNYEQSWEGAWLPEGQKHKLAKEAS